MKKVLMVDDNAIVLLAMKSVLNDLKYFVETALNGKEGLMKFQENSFDIVFLDLNLPDINGLEVLREMKIQQPDVPVVVITGYSETDSDTSLSLKASDYMVKPLDPETIQEAIIKFCKD